MTTIDELMERYKSAGPLVPAETRLQAVHAALDRFVEACDECGGLLARSADLRAARYLAHSLATDIGSSLREYPQARRRTTSPPASRPAPSAADPWRLAAAAAGLAGRYAADFAGDDRPMPAGEGWDTPAFWAAACEAGSRGLRRIAGRRFARDGR